jgi:hypothetical protein
MAKIMKLRFGLDKIPGISGIDSKLLTIIRASDDIFADGVSEQFIHIDQEQPNFIPIYLKSEISKLNQKDIFCDGTFSVVRNLPFSQIYIFSILYSDSGKGVFSYPLFLFLMKKNVPSLIAKFWIF